MTTIQFMPGGLAQALAALHHRQQSIHATVRLDAAVDRAFGRFAAQHGGWSESLFDRHFLSCYAAGTLAAFAAGKISQQYAAEELAVVWDRQFGSRSTERRSRRRAELVPAAGAFLGWVAHELT